MKIYAIIAEFNPFHNGHQKLIEYIKTNDPTSAIVVLMSGSLVQRGEFAIFDKWYRANCALNSNVNLVLELPFSFSCQNAEYFANGAIKILNSLNIIDEIVFASKCGEINKLKYLSNSIDSIIKEESEAMKANLNEGKSYIKSRFDVLKRTNKLDKSDLKLLESANDILGIEYILAAKKQKCNIDFNTFKRYDCAINYKSATEIRKLIYKNKDVSNYLPYDIKEKNIKLPDYKVYYEIIRYKYLIDKNIDEYFPDYEDGLLNRIESKLKNSNSFNELVNLAHHKRITKSRIKRLIANQILNHKADIVKKAIAHDRSYIRILGFDKLGRELIKNISDEQFIINKFSQIEKINDELIKEIAHYELKATNLRELLVNGKINRDFYESPVIC